MSPEGDLEQAYEALRMKAIEAGNAIPNQSHLVFLTKGMKVWLETMVQVKPLIAEPEQASGQVMIAQSVKPAAVMLLADMVLNTWKGASTC